MTSHASQPSALTVLAGLMVLTAIEYVFSIIGAGLLLLLVVAFFKFLLVVVYFMHLPRIWNAPAAEAAEQEHE
jgi:hypothetical protein